MKNLIEILVALDEARRFIEDGREAQLRIALILLDNAAELQLMWRVEDHLDHEKFKERLRANILGVKDRVVPTDLQKYVEWTPLTDKQKKRISQVFGAKVEYLCDRAGSLDPRIDKPLEALHQYRNEAYHAGRVRKETISTAARLLLEINCLLLPSTPGMRSYSSDGDYSWLEERFGVKASQVFSREDFIVLVTEEIRSQVSLTEESLKETLRDHVISRIDNLLCNLEFIRSSSKDTDAEEALRTSHYYGEVRRNKLNTKEMPLDGFQSDRRAEHLESTRSDAKSIVEAHDKLSAFSRFADLESRIEPIENDVLQLASEIDSYIELLGGIERGK